MQKFESTLNISNYTVELYRELFGKPHPIGSGILIDFHDQHLLISAYHVIDLENERTKIENDPDEVDIPQDDMEGIMAKGISKFFYINNKVKAFVWSAHYDDETKDVIFNDDVEWCVCELSKDIVRYLNENGKAFYKIDEHLSLNIRSGAQIIVSGYPKYAQKEGQEIYRSFISELIEDYKIDESGLFRVHFNHARAYCIEFDREIQTPRRDGIKGMSGGGIWYSGIDNFIPLGIIIKQDQNENYIEGYNMYEILKSYSKKNI